MNKLTAQLNLNGISVTLQAEGEHIESLYSIVDRFSRNLLLKPPHQRDPVWDEEKKLGWILRLRGQLKPVGIIVTYQLDNGQASPIYLNDGFQRINTTKEYLNNPEPYGDTREQAEQYIYSCNMPVQHRHYYTHDDALIDFQQLNLGTALTPYEFCKGILTYMKNWDRISPILEMLLNTIHICGERVRNKRMSVSRQRNHKLIRDTYALFLRFLLENDALDFYDSAATQMKFTDVSRKKAIEWRLRELLEDIDNIELIEKSAKTLISLIERETALIEKIWFDDLEKEIGKGINLNLYRWLLHIAVWKRYNNKTTESWNEFLTKVLQYSNGQSNFPCHDEDGNLISNYQLQLSKISPLEKVCEIVGSSFFSRQTHKRKKNNDTRPGYDNSHLKPFVKFGDGPTFPEPASLNRARGAKEVEHLSRSS